MRCLNCGQNGISLSTEFCHNCGVHLATLLQNCLPPGTILWHDTYRIDYALGRGGFGITYRAFDRSLEKAVAIKEFFPQDYALREQTTGLLKVTSTQKGGAYQRGLERFLREGRRLASLDRDGVVRVFNSFQERGTAYLVMELIDGITIRDELNRQPDRKLSPARVQDIFSKLVDALDNVHRQQVYHLDISPDNVMLTKDEKRVVLIDFGASRQGLGGQTTQAFKEAYAPPEVFNGEGMGAESDVFELGMMLCELLTGKLPPSAISRLTSIITHDRDTWEPPRELKEPWLGLVNSAIRLKQQERPQNVRDWWHQKSSVPQSSSSESSGSESSIPPQPGHLSKSPAGFWLRSLAWTIDLNILLLSSLILTFIVGIGQTQASIFFCYVLLSFIYSPILDSSPKQGTFGKQMMKIKVTDLSGRRVSFQRSLTRHTSKIFSYLTFFVGFSIAGFTRKKQALHDRVTKCLVIKNN
jgi:serine/threonine protein kinase